MLNVMHPAAFFLILILLLTGWASYAISRAVYKKLANAGNTNAKVLRVVAMIGSFIIILVTLFILIINNVRFER